MSGKAGELLAETGTYETIEEILAVYRPVMHAIAAAGGASCEVVLHDLSSPDPDLEHTIAAIENGHVTGREVGGPSSSLGAGVLHDQAADHNAYGYRGFASDGRQLRCSSVYFRSASGRIIAALCINQDLGPLQRIQGLLADILPADRPEDEGSPREFFGGDLVSMMDTMVTEAIREAGAPVAHLSRDDRVAILARLERQGVLQMRKGIESVAARLGISRVTAYSYLEEAHSRGRQG